MAGRGPTPKDPSRRARRNADPVGTTTLRRDKVEPPNLPDHISWPEATREWWNRWRTSPQAETFAATDWDFLLDTAVLHASLWSGDTKAAPELRLRVAKFGATVEDRARLRMTFAAADEADDRRKSKKGEPVKSGADAVYGELRLVAGGEAKPSKPRARRTTKKAAAK